MRGIRARFGTGFMRALDDVNAGRVSGFGV